MHARATPSAVLIVGDFKNPARSSTGWREIGPGMSEALSRALLNRGRYDVIIKPALSRNLQKLAGESAPQEDPSLDEVRAAHPEVEFVVIGAVTDFQHTTDLPEELAPRTWTGSPRREAIVAIDLVVVDLRNERLVSAEHVTGTAPSGKTPSRTLYKDVAFGSYVFWNTPLGRASTNAIERAVSRIDALVPEMVPAGSYSIAASGSAWNEARIAQQTSLRGVEIAGGRNCGLLPNQLYALLPANAQTSDDALLRDVDTGRLMLVKIHDASEGSASGWLMGKCDEPQRLAGARLRPVPASAADTASTAARNRFTPTSQESHAVGIGDTVRPASDPSKVTQAGAGAAGQPN